jgi:hypothetical protein
MATSYGAMGSSRVPISNLVSPPPDLPALLSAASVENGRPGTGRKLPGHDPWVNGSVGVGLSGNITQGHILPRRANRRQHHRMVGWFGCG